MSCNRLHYDLYQAAMKQQQSLGPLSLATIAIMAAIFQQNIVDNVDNTEKKKNNEKTILYYFLPCIHNKTMHLLASHLSIVPLTDDRYKTDICSRRVHCSVGVWTLLWQECCGGGGAGRGGPPQLRDWVTLAWCRTDRRGRAPSCPGSAGSSRRRSCSTSHPPAEATRLDTCGHVAVQLDTWCLQLDTWCLQLDTRWCSWSEHVTLDAGDVESPSVVAAEGSSGLVWPASSGRVS